MMSGTIGPMMFVNNEMAMKMTRTRTVTSYNPAVGDDSPRVVSTPFSELWQVASIGGPGTSPVFKPADVIEFAAYIHAGGHFEEGAFYIDGIRAVSLPAAGSARGFDEAADSALAAMRKRAGELGIGGVAVVAWFEGESIRSWTSKMVVVDRYKDEPTPTNKGSNLLAIAYAKASEMADTLKNSGSGARPPMTGEFGWPGGAIARGATGYWIAAFSGGKSEEDVQVSKAGLAVLQ
jgi:hypothetical protein